MKRELSAKARAAMAAGARNGKREDKVRAGKAGYAALVRKLQDSAKQ